MLQQRWEAKIRRKESSPQPGIELTTTRSWVGHAHHWADRAGFFKVLLVHIFFYNNRPNHEVQCIGLAMLFRLVRRNWAPKQGSGKLKKKKWCDFGHSRVLFMKNFVSFLRHFLSILSSDFTGAACRVSYTKRKYRCDECRTRVYVHAMQWLFGMKKNGRWQKIQTRVRMRGFSGWHGPYLLVDTLTISQTTHFQLFQIGFADDNFKIGIQWLKGLQRGRKHWGKRNNFSFSHSVFKRLVSQGRQKVSLCGNGLSLVFSEHGLFLPYQLADKNAFWWR